MPKRIVCFASARRVWCETGAAALCLECVSRVEPVLPAKIASGASAAPLEAAWLVTRALTRRHREQKRVDHVQQARFPPQQQQLRSIRVKRVLPASMRPQRATTRRGPLLRVEGVNTLPQRVLAARAPARSVLLANISTPREVTRSRTALAVKQACSPPQQEQPHSIRVKRVVPASMRPQRATTKRGTALRVEVVNTLHQRVLAARAFARRVRQILHRQRPAVRCRIANATPDQLVPMGARALRVWRASSKPRAALLCVPRVRRADILRVWAPHQTCVNSAIQAAKLVSIRAVAVQAQGSWSARTALRFRDIIAQRDPPTGAQQQGSHAHRGIFVSVVLRTRRCVMLARDGTALLEQRP